MVINGIELDFSIFDADTADKYETAIQDTRDRLANLQDVLQAEGIGNMIRSACQAGFECFNTIFGKGADRKIFGDQVNFQICMDAFMELDTKVAQEIQDYVRVMNTYSAARVKRQ